MSVPLFETACKNESCELYAFAVEHFYHHADSEPCACEACGKPTHRLYSTFNSPFTGVMSITKYGDSRSEPRKGDGHVMYRKNSSRSGNPEPVYIETWEEQRRFCKEENLMNPTDLPTNAKISRDGKSWETRGMPGQWV
jgi:hypothetical protein